MRGDLGLPETNGKASKRQADKKNCQGTTRIFALPCRFQLPNLFQMVYHVVAILDFFVVFLLFGWYVVHGSSFSGWTAAADHSP